MPVEGRADKFSGAFNDPANAPDVAEFGNTDVSSYAATGALADLTGDLASWREGKDLIPTVLDTAKSGGKTYGLPWYTGIRALYYRTDVFTELGLKPPATLAELTDDRPPDPRRQAGPLRHLRRRQVHLRDAALPLGQRRGAGAGERRQVEVDGHR